jgi:TRAP-type C4-dicarboxylate transport system substrate-binding protein
MTMEMLMVKPWIAATIAAAALVATAAPSVAANETETFTVISGLPGGHPAVRIFREHFRSLAQQQMAAAGDGMTLKWRPAYDGTIAKHGDVLEAIADGVGDFGLIALDYETQKLPLQDISFHLPFSTTQCAVAAGAYHDLHKVSVDMNMPWQKAGQIYLANITTDGYGLFTGPKIKLIEDLRGLTMGVAVRIEPWLSGVAAKPFRMPLGQFDGALEANIIDGAIMPVTQIAELKLEERLNNYLLTEFGPQTAFAITMNGQRFADLPGPLRDALLEAADQFVPVAAQAYCDAGKSTLDDLKKKGMRTQRFFNSRREQWIAALPPLGQLWASAREAEGYPGSEILTAYMDNLRAAGAKPKRDWDLDPAPTN